MPHSALSLGTREDIQGGYERRTRGVQVPSRSDVCLLPACGVIGLACVEMIQPKSRLFIFFILFAFLCVIIYINVFLYSAEASSFPPLLLV